MNQYTKGEWKARKLSPDPHGIITKEAWEIATPEYDVVAFIEHSAPIRKETDAHLIISAVNACASVNPDNPQAVAESIKELYEALKGLAKAYNVDGENMIQDLPIYWQNAMEALAKAEGKQ